MIVYVVTTFADGCVVGVYTTKRRARAALEREKRNGVLCSLSEVEVNEGCIEVWYAEDNNEAALKE